MMYFTIGRENIFKAEEHQDFGNISIERERERERGEGEKERERAQMVFALETFGLENV